MKRQLFWLVFILAISLRVIALSQRPLSSDEVWTMAVIKNNVSDIVSASFADFRPPLYYLLVQLWKVFFGGSFTELRVVSTIASLVAIYFIYKTSLYISSPKHSLVAFLISGISAGLIYDAADARMMSLTFCFTSILCWSFTAYLKTGQAKYLIFMGISGILAVYTYYYPLLVLPFVFWYILRKGKNPISLAVGTLFGISLIPLVLGIIWSIRYAAFYHTYLINNPLKLAAIFFIPFIPSEFVIFELINYPGDRFPLYLLMASLVLFLTIVTLQVIPKIPILQLLLLMFFCVLPLTILLLVSQYWRPVISVHTIIIFTLPFYLLIPQLLNKSKKILMVFIIFVAILSSYYLYNIRKTKPQIDYLGTVAQNYEQANVILVNNIYSHLWLNYFNPKLLIFAYTPSVFNPVIEHSLGYTIIDADDVSANKITLVEMPYLDFKTEALAFKLRLNERYNLISQKNYTNAFVYTYQKK